MATILTVPIHVDALVIDVPREVVGPEADIARSPWFGADIHGTKRDHHPQTANVAAAVRHDPMTPHSIFLEAGVHLHWSLPDRTARGSTKDPGHASYVERNGLWFPQAPNRWIVARSDLRSGTIESLWFIESDYVHPWGTGQQAVAYPVKPTGNRTYPYVRVGRSTLLQGDVNLGNTSGPSLRKVDAPLTAVGPGDPSFGALYTACHSIFGAHDPSMDNAPASYSVLGWYSADKDDPRHSWTTTEGRTKEAVARILGSIIEDPAERPTPESIVDLPASIIESQEILFAHRTGWAIADASPSGILDCEGTHFFGTVDVDRQTASTYPEPVTSTVSIGTSPREAVSTILAFDYGNAALETELEAITFGLELAEHELDLGVKLDEFRHSAGFHPTGQKVLWEFRPQTSATSNPLDTTTAPPALAGPLPLELAHQLNYLNIAQDELVEAEDRLEWSRQQVFAHWQMYMMAAYPKDDEANFPVDIDALRDVVLPQAMEQCRIDAATVEMKSIETASQHYALELALATHSLQASEGPELQLSASSGPRYWRPNDPSVAIDHAEALLPTRRHGLDHRARADGKLECLVTQLPSIANLDNTHSISEVLYYLRSNGTAAFNVIARTQAEQQVWHPILVEWQGTVSPALAGSNQRASTGQFDPEVVTSHYRFAEQACDLQPIGGTLGKLGDPYLVSGRSLLTGHGPEIVLARVREYLGRLDTDIGLVTEQITALDNRAKAIDTELGDPAMGTPAKVSLRAEKASALTSQKKLKTSIKNLEALHKHYDTLAGDLDTRVGLGSQTRIVTFSLGGVMDRLLMLRDEPQLPIADPLGFPRDQTVAMQVGDMVADAAQLFTPEPTAPFLPLSSAEFSLFDGRVIDSFGQYVRWSPKGDPANGRSLIAAETIKDTNGAAMLRPRSAQPARLNFRWLSARRNDVESNDHPAASPLCGWLVPNDTDQSIMLYDAAGEMLGMVDDRQLWHPAPGVVDAPKGPGLIDNPHLRRVVEWLVNGTDDQFVDKFLAVADSALRRIDPYDYATHNSRALLVGRPIAIARAQVSLKLQGRPAKDNSPAALALRIDGHDPGDHGFGNIKFPIRIGEHGQFNDGLVGYFVDTDEQAPHSEMFAPQSDTLTPANHGVHAAANSPSFTIYDESAKVPVNLHCSFDDPPVQLTMLLDPRCPVHATCGILPTKSVRIPRDQFEPSMNDLQMMFSAMPVLTGADELDLPLPSEPGNRWSWVAMMDGHWSDIPALPTVELETLRAALPGRVVIAADGSISEFTTQSQVPIDGEVQPKADLLWAKLIHEGWLDPITSTRAYLGQTGSTELGKSLPTDTISALLSKIALRISSAERGAALRPRAIAREGWLKLAPTPKRHSDEILDHPPPPPAATPMS